MKKRKQKFIFSSEGQSKNFDWILHSVTEHASAIKLILKNYEGVKITVETL